MDLIENLKQRMGERFQVECRATQGPLRRTECGTPIVPFRLVDMSGTLPAYTIDSDILSRMSLLPDTQVIATVQIERSNHRPIGQILTIQPIDASYPARCLPHSWCPAPTYLPTLARCIESLTYYPLIKFMESVLNDIHIIKLYLSIPASIKHHHSCPAGLLIHSLECATRVHNFLRHDDAWTRDLAVVAALLHDVGKIRTLAPDIRYQRSALLLDHNTIALEVLAPHLSLLSGMDSDVSDALRYILTWNSSKYEKSPKLPVALAVKMADRFSAGTDAARLAFAKAPGWKQLATHNSNGPKQFFWRQRSCRHLQAHAHEMGVCATAISHQLPLGI